MFDLDLPWWEFMVRGAFVYATLLVMVRISGKRTIGQFTPFDLLVVMLLSEAVSPSLSGGDDSLLGGAIIAGTLIMLNRSLAFITSRNETIAQALDGVPVLIGRDGAFFKEVAKRNWLAQGDLEQALREADCKLEDMQFAVLESDGTITIQKKAS